MKQQTKIQRQQRVIVKRRTSVFEPLEKAGEILDRDLFSLAWNLV
jgi:hypothetical protein